MHEVSDGERRRVKKILIKINNKYFKVQILLGLLKPFELLLLDEVTGIFLKNFLYNTFSGFRCIS